MNAGSGDLLFVAKPRFDGGCIAPALGLLRLSGSEICRGIAQFADATSSSRKTGAIYRLAGQFISVQTTCFCREGVCPFAMRLVGREGQGWCGCTSVEGSSRNGPLHLEVLNTRSWRKALKRAGITNFRWHDLRHTWASWLVQRRVPLFVLQELGGWQSAEMVRRYAHLSPSVNARYAAEIDLEFARDSNSQPSGL